MKKGKNHLSLYTFVLEFKGGTYLSQVRASSPKESKEKWAIKVYEKGDIDLSGCTKREFIKLLRDDEMVSVTTCSKVWCSTFLIFDDLGLIHIIETSAKNA